MELEENLKHGQEEGGPLQIIANQAMRTRLKELKNKK